MLLHGHGVSARVSDIIWDKARALADEFGWDPAGTKAPVNRLKWDGDYGFPQGQRVQAPDARAFAAALERGHSLCADEDTLDVYVIPSRVARANAMKLPVDHECFLLPVDVLEDVRPLDFFSGSRRELLEELVDLGYAGGFRVLPG